MEQNNILSYLKNTLIAYRKNEFGKIGITNDGKVHVRLNGYAIIPIELYEKLSPSKSDIEKYCSGTMKVIQAGDGCPS